MTRATDERSETLVAAYGLLIKWGRERLEGEAAEDAASFAGATTSPAGDDPEIEAVSILSSDNGRGNCGEHQD